ncbi:MAG: hypothetical protein V1720_20815 [bacterium]
MKIEQTKWTESKGWLPRKPGVLSNSAQLVILFASTSIIKYGKCGLHNQTMIITTLSED